MSNRIRIDDLCQIFAAARTVRTEKPSFRLTIDNEES